MLVCVPGTYISPFVLALEGGVNPNPSRRERLFLRTANPRQDQRTWLTGSVLPHTGDQARSVELQRTDGRPSVSKPYFTQTIYKFQDRLVGGSDSALVSTAAELKFNRNPAIHPPYDIVKQCPCEPRKGVS